METTAVAWSEPIGNQAVDHLGEYHCAHAPNALMHRIVGRVTMSAAVEREPLREVVSPLADGAACRRRRLQTASLADGAACTLRLANLSLSKN